MVEINIPGPRLNVAIFTPRAVTLVLATRMFLTWFESSPWLEISFYGSQLFHGELHVDQMDRLLERQLQEQMLLGLGMGCQ